MRYSRSGWSEFFPGAPDVFAVTALRLDADRGIVWGASPDVLAVLGSDRRQPRLHRVFALEATTGRLIRSVALPKGAFANDVALDGRGGLYVTDSLGGRVWRLKADADVVQLVVEDTRFRRGALGPAGIVRTPDGDLLVGLFSAGELFRVSRPDDHPIVEKLRLQRSIERLDGLALARDGRLLAIEGGRGALLIVDTCEGTISDLATGLSGPVNLTLNKGDIWVSESGIDDPAGFDPAVLPSAGFSLRRVPLPLSASPSQSP
jgi:streptogramin lyase